MAVISLIVLILQGLAAVAPLILELIDRIRGVKDPVKAAGFTDEMHAGIAFYKTAKDSRPLKALLDRIHAHCDLCK